MTTENNLRLLIMGPQGVGKGTQAAKIAEKFGLHAISTGDIFRYHMKHETELGKKVQEVINKGELVSDELTGELVRHSLSSGNSIDEGFILDGYPRNHNQVVDLDATLDELGLVLDGVVLLTADHDVLMDRILKRAEIEGRADDTPEAIAKRLNIYDTETAPLINEYRNRELLISVDGTQDIDAVSAEIFSALAKL
jgi:adenylate kinase